MWAEAIFGWACAFLIGYSINQGGTCGVAAARDLVHDRRIDGFAGFAVASGAAGVVCLPVAWALGTGAHLGSIAALAPGIVLGAILLGFGALLNDACLLGSLWRLGNGELRLLALPVGLAIGFAAAPWLSPMLLPTTHPNPLSTPGAGGLVVVAISAVILALALAILRRLPTGEARRWPLWFAMAVLGTFGALLYVVQPGWSYADAVRRGVAPLTAMMMTGWSAAIAAGLTVVGAALSAARLGVFRPARPAFGAILRSLGGGTLIALGASLIPGGNDTLLLASVPSGSLSGAAAYTIMTLVIIATIAVMRRLGRPPDSSTSD